MKKILLALALPALALLCRADAPPTTVKLFSAEKVNALFAKKGGTLLQNDLYKVMAGRRAPPGPFEVEIHTHDTDVFYIVDGSATFVTGGKAIGMKEKSPGEWRGKTIEGGTPHHLQKGDVIVVPHGIPHLFTQVDGPFLYFVVKVTQPE